MATDRVRRRVVTATLALAGGLAGAFPTRADELNRRPIPRTGEMLPAIGMGTWLTFDIGASHFDLARRRQVLDRHAPGRYLRDPGNDQSGAHAREHRGGAWSLA